MRKFVMLNAHGGNSPLMTVVATELRVRYGMLAVATSWTRFGYPADLVLPRRSARSASMAGFVETSVMLALRPDPRRDGKGAGLSVRPKPIRTGFHLFAAPMAPHAFGWKMGDLSAEGVVGNAAAASAEAGGADAGACGQGPGGTDRGCGSVRRVGAR